VLAGLEADGGGTGEGLQHGNLVTWVTLALTAGVPLELVQKVSSPVNIGRAWADWR
jgi:hypothetical protein